MAPRGQSRAARPVLPEGPARLAGLKTASLHVSILDITATVAVFLGIPLAAGYRKITSQRLDVARIALPLLAYFGITWSAGFAISRRLHLTYPRTAALAFARRHETAWRGAPSETGHLVAWRPAA